MKNATILLLTVLSGCGMGRDDDVAAPDSARTRQTFPAGMQAVCAGETPTEAEAVAISGYVSGDHLPKVHRLVVLRDAVARAKVGSCARLDALARFDPPPEAQAFRRPVAIADVGIHKSLGSDMLGRGPLKNVFGDKTGFDSKLNAAMAGAGDDLVVGHGAGGMGLRGSGSGGGGEGFGRIHGMGRIDTGGGRGTRANLGGKKKRKSKARMRRGKATLSGFCRETDVQRVVAARQRGLQYCYEKELARNPELQGKVTLAWRIGLDGSVPKAFVEGSTLGNEQVEACMTRQIQRWKFPKPGGGMCQIRYPFVFNSGG